MMKKYLFLLLTVIILFVVNILFGSVHIALNDVWAVLMGRGDDAATHFIILEHRLPQAITALLVGAALSTAGLLLQTTFHNPLAGPGVLGISGGASLGVAILLLGGVAHSLTLGDGMIAIYVAAFVGAVGVTVLLLFISSIVRSNVVLLIVGMLLGYLISAVITILYVVASPEGLHDYVIWGMGDFSSVTLQQLRPFCIVLLVAMCGAWLLSKSLNALQLGDMYAQNLGIRLKTLRNSLLLVVGVLVAVSTAYCGPISFLGLAVPHITRLFFPITDFRRLIPLNIVMGSAVALLCNSLSTLPTGTLLPLNAVTPLVGIPVIVWVIIRK